MIKKQQLILIEMCQLVLKENQDLRSSLVRVRLLLKDAITMLNENFFSVNETLQGRPSTDESERPSPTNLLETLTQALSITKQLNHMLNKTTQSLQVEDIVSQIVEQLSKRSETVDGMMLQLLEQLQMNTLDEQAVEQMAEKVKNLHTEITRKIVNQSSLDEGEVELF